MIQNEQEMKQVIDQILRCEEEIGKTIIGQHSIIRQMIIAILTDGNVLLEGVPGVGKTQMVKSISRSMNLAFSRIQFTPDLMPADVTGTNLIVKEEGQNKFQFEAGPIFANIVLADEINRATPKTQSALLEAMQEKTVTVGKQTYLLPKPFMVLATQNPIENEGTYPLPEAQLDRFLFKLNVRFPSKEELRDIVNLTVNQREAAFSPVMTAEDILRIRQIIYDIPIADAVMDYAMDLVYNTHPELKDVPDITKKYISNGASPRAAQAIIKTAKARALMENRFNVSFEDIQYVAFPVLRHRIICNFEALSDNMTPDKIIAQLIQQQ
ncbi:MAG: MoxR family ATPase [Bacteroides sp.]|nr:MoxR family ATPase [Bacteroides sp.]MCM1549464.1 MoxR family ATPase [Clostridium sp.]